MLTQECLKEYLHYDSETGIFTWIKRPYHANRIKIGEHAGSNHIMGYRATRLFNTRYLLHRLAWLYEYGKFPDDDIDHINGIKNDNRICNLRESTDYGNMQNMIRPTKRNKLGLLGVSYDKTKKKYVAQIHHNGKYTHIGRFDTKEAAYEAYLKAKRKHHSTCTI
jgi:hypothetical protein